MSENYGMREVQDFPKKGISFKDVTGILNSPKNFAELTKDMVESLKENDIDFDKIVGIDARGFIFATALAVEMEKPLVLARKEGKLPNPAISQEYDLEYGSAKMEMQLCDIDNGDKVVLVDDILATGGTIEAVEGLVYRLGGEVVAVVAIADLVNLNGKDKIECDTILSMIEYEDVEELE